MNYWISLLSCLLLVACVTPVVDDEAEERSAARSEPVEIYVVSISPRGVATLRANCTAADEACHVQIIDYCARRFIHSPQVISHRIRDNELISIAFRCRRNAPNLMPQHILYTK